MRAGWPFISFGTELALPAPTLSSVSAGTPVTLAITAVEASYTGRYLKPVLAPAAPPGDTRIERRASMTAARGRKASSDLLG